MARPFSFTRSSVSPRQATQDSRPHSLPAVGASYSNIRRTPLQSKRTGGVSFLACSSTVEQTAVNRSVLGSIPSGPALAANNADSAPKAHCRPNLGTANAAPNTDSRLADGQRVESPLRDSICGNGATESARQPHKLEISGFNSLSRYTGRAAKSAARPTISNKGN